MIRPEFNAQRLERTMRWLRANGITEDASEIRDNVHFDEDDGRIYYEVWRPGTGNHRLSVPQRVGFDEANRGA